MAAPTIEVLYNALTEIMGVHPDFPETWQREMKTLYYFRLYKKVMKSQGTYIDGGVGRGTVYAINATEASRGDRMVRRGDSYWALNGLLPPDSMWLHQPDFNVNGTATKRWSAGVHVIPWGSELRDLQISRFDNGLLIHFDASQMEIRILAALSRDANLLEAFRQGKDVHRYVASRVWGIPEDQVTDAQRRFSKMASFAILYGKTVDQFAIDFMGGDIEGTKKLFNDLFTQFPGILDYIQESHDLLDKQGWVPTLWGDPIVIDWDRDKRGAHAEAYRQAQNYRCQGSASNVMGVCLNRISSEIADQGYKSKL
jgi:hypothetical protein